jgi:hypothetical protein
MHQKNKLRYTREQWSIEGTYEAFHQNAFLDTHPLEGDWEERKACPQTGTSSLLTNLRIYEMILVWTERLSYN